LLIQIKQKKQKKTIQDSNKLLIKIELFFNLIEATTIIIVQN